MWTISTECMPQKHLSGFAIAQVRALKTELLQLSLRKILHFRPSRRNWSVSKQSNQKTLPKSLQRKETTANI
jgi:hypothetical protein